MTDQTDSAVSTRRLLSEVAMGVFAVFSPAVWLIGEQTVAWPWVGYGMGITVVGYVISWTAIGHRVGTWFTRIGQGGRFLCIVFAAIFIWCGIWTIDPQIPSTMSLLFGGTISLFGVSVFRLCNRLWSGG